MPRQHERKGAAQYPNFLPTVMIVRLIAINFRFCCESPPVIFPMVETAINGRFSVITTGTARSSV